MKKAGSERLAEPGSRRLYWHCGACSRYVLREQQVCECGNAKRPARGKPQVNEVSLPLIVAALLVLSGLVALLVS